MHLVSLRQLLGKKKIWTPTWNKIFAEQVVSVQRTGKGFTVYLKDCDPVEVGENLDRNDFVKHAMDNGFVVTQLEGGQTLVANRIPSKEEVRMAATLAELYGMNKKQLTDAARDMGMDPQKKTKAQLFEAIARQVGVLDEHTVRQDNVRAAVRRIPGVAISTIQIRERPGVAATTEKRMRYEDGKETGFTRVKGYNMKSHMNYWIKRGFEVVKQGKVGGFAFVNLQMRS